jgi:hypothetical protein
VISCIAFVVSAALFLQVFVFDRSLKAKNMTNRDNAETDRGSDDLVFDEEKQPSDMKSLGSKQVM